jgi:ABC-2 type transport system ATP-binding protein
MKDSIMINGTNLTKTFYNFWGKPKAKALSDLNITVKKGEITGLLGPNGAGKSTLMKLLLGHLYPTSGTLKVMDKSPRDVMTKRFIGYLPERTSFYRNLNARETLHFFAALLGLEKKEATNRIEQLINMVGLSGIGTRLVGEFSNGMRKRLGLAQALLNDPELLLLDEPTAGLDPVGCREVKDLIKVLKERGKTILMTTHLLGDVQDVSDTILILYGGKLKASGSINDLLAVKDEILIHTNQLKDNDLSKIKAIIQQASAAGKFQVSHPIQTLEDYFLKVISDAGDNTYVSGAKQGQGVAEYLKNGITENK